MINYKKVLLLVLVIFIYYIPAANAFNYVMGDTSYIYDISPSKPAKSSFFVDPLFNTTVTRITNHVTDSSGASRAGVEYSTWSPLSSDGRYLLLELGQNGYGVWNAGPPYTFYKNVSSVLAGWNSQNAEGRWDLSGSHPTWVYYRKDRSLRRLDVETDQDVSVRDFSTELSAAGFGSSYYIINGDEGTNSEDSNVWAWIVKNQNSPYDEPAMLVYDKNTNAVNIKNVSAYGGVNSVKVSPSGNYLAVAFNPSGSYVGEGRNPGIYNISAHAISNNPSMFTNFFQYSAGVPHDAWSTDKQGHEVMVNLSPGGNQADYLIMTRADNGAVYKLYYQGNMGWNLGGINHMTGPSAKSGWAFMSTYSNAGNLGWPSAQIFAFEIDETKCVNWYSSYNAGSGTACSQNPRIWRIALEQSFTGADYYYQQPNAAIDKNGTRIWFGSNWRDQTVNSMDVYQVDLPVTWLSDLSGTIPIDITAPSAPTGLSVQ